MGNEDQISKETSSIRRFLMLTIGGLALGAGVNVMLGAEDLASDGAGAVLAAAGGSLAVAGIINPEQASNARQQR